MAKQKKWAGPMVPQRLHCRWGYGKYFSTKTNTLMHNSPIGCKQWTLAIHLITTSLKGVSSIKLRRNLGISQKSTWHYAADATDRREHGREAANF